MSLRHRGKAAIDSTAMILRLMIAVAFMTCLLREAQATQPCTYLSLFPPKTDYPLSNFELVQRSDAIVLARPFSSWSLRLFSVVFDTQPLPFAVVESGTTILAQVGSVSVEGC